jgi:RimK family alpha-L-glutamate ligase
MRGLLVYNAFFKSGGAKFSEINGLYAAAFARAKVTLTPCSNAELAVRLPLRGEDRPAYDFALFLDKDIRLAEHLERRGLRLFNSAAAIAACDDKAVMYGVLDRRGIPFPQTVLAPFVYNNQGYTDLSFLDGAEGALGFPVVVKECFGSFGAQVYLAKNRTELETLVKKIGAKPHLYQKFVSESAGRDIRVNVVGGRVAAAMKRHNPNDFRSNITLGGRAEAYAPTDEEGALAVAACAALGLDFGGADIFYGNGAPVVCEVNSNCHIKSITEATGINVADMIAEYVVNAVKIR